MTMLWHIYFYNKKLLSYTNKLPILTFKMQFNEKNT